MGPSSHCHQQSHARSYHHSVQTQCFCTRAGLFLWILFQILVQGSEADGVAHAFPLSANNFILQRQSPPCSHLPCRRQRHKNISLTSLTPRVINAVSKQQLHARVDFRVVLYENASFRPWPSWCCCGKPGAGAAAVPPARTTGCRVAPVTGERQREQTMHGTEKKETNRTAQAKQGFNQGLYGFSVLNM